MTRAECEAGIEKHMEAIIGILKEYSPECKYLSACYIENDEYTTYFVNNEHFRPNSPDAKRPIWVHKEI